MKLVELDFYEMKVEGHGKFDAIVFSSSFLNLERKEEAIQKAKELLNSGGHIYFMVTLSDSNFGDALKYVTSIDLHL